MYNSMPQTGIASLVASPYADSDVMNVRMTPREVAGLQQLAMSYGATEQDLYDPITGQPRFNFLKKLLPMIAGAVLNTVAPGVGTAIGGLFGATGTAAATLGTGLLVGGATALIEGDLKKGLMAGLGAYSGASLSAGLKAAAAAPTAEQVAAEKVLTTQGAEKAAEQLGLTESATQLAKPSMLATGPKVNPFTGAPATTPTLAQPVSIGTGATALNAPAMAATPSFGTAPVGLAAVNAAPMAVLASSAAPAAATGPLAGINALFRPEGRTAFMETLGGGYKTPLAQSLSKYAVLTGALDAMTPEYKIPTADASDDLVYISGGYNPRYMIEPNQPALLPGGYYRRTPQGLVPVNPYAMAPKTGGGFAAGGPVQPVDQNMNQPRSIPHPYQPIPMPNQNYPLSTVTQGNYSSSAPQGREVVGGYETKIDPFTGEERFAEGGLTTSPYSAPAATAADTKRKFEQMLYGPPPAPRDVQPVMDYLAKLSERVKQPIVAAPPLAPPPPPPGPPPGPPPDDRDPSDKYDPYKGGLGGFGGVGGGFGGIGTRGGTGLPPGYQTGIGAGGSNYYQTFQPNIQDKFPVNIDPTKAVDKALGNTVLDKAKNKFLDWAKYRFTDPAGLVGTAIGMTGAGAIGTFIWDKLSPKVKEYFAGVDKVLTPEEEAEAEAEAAAIAQSQNVSGGGGGGGFDRDFGGPTSYGNGSLQNFIDQFNMNQMFSTGDEWAGGIYDMEGRKIGKKTGGSIKAMQAGGMTAPNPYGAAMGEDYNFGFSGGGKTEYAAAGKLLDGPGDGMSDDIPAVIRGKGVQRAALADGEFVIPADVVSHLGNGSTNAGAKKLYKMMAQVRQARTGRTKQAPAVKMNKYLPA